jgi:hypothetical protein
MPFEELYERLPDALRWPSVYICAAKQQASDTISMSQAGRMYAQEKQLHTPTIKEFALQQRRNAGCQDQSGPAHCTFKQQLTDHTLLAICYCQAVHPLFNSSHARWSRAKNLAQHMNTADRNFCFVFTSDFCLTSVHRASAVNALVIMLA